MASGKLARISAAFGELLSTLSFLPVPERDSQGNETHKFLIDRKPLKCNYDGNGTIELVEENSCGIKQVYITGLDSDSVVIKPDLFGIKFFKDNTYNRSCDYLILTQHNQTYYAIFIDLKTDIDVERNSEDNNVKYFTERNIKMAWQMAGGEFLLDSLLTLAQKLHMITTKSGFKHVYALIFCTPNYICASHGAAVPTGLPVVPPREMVNPNNFFWFMRNSGARIGVTEIVQLAK